VRVKVMIKSADESVQIASEAEVMEATKVRLGFTIQGSGSRGLGFRI
jgi:hypothetical protein